MEGISCEAGCPGSERLGRRVAKLQALVEHLSRLLKVITVWGHSTLYLPRIDDVRTLDRGDSYGRDDGGWGDGEFVLRLQPGGD